MLQTHLNLLPWREMRRKEQDRQLLAVLAGVAVLTGLMVFYAHLHVSGMIDNQVQRNNFLKQQITLVNKQIEEIKNLKKQRQALISRMNIIYQLQGDRTQVVHVFDELVKRLPEGVYFDSVTQKGKVITIKGTAQSNARVSALMRNLEQSNWFINPDLKVINVKTTKGAAERVSVFDMTVKQTDKRAKKDDEEEQQPAKKPARGRR